MEISDMFIHDDGHRDGGGYLDGGVGGDLVANYRRCGGGGYYAAINGKWWL